MLPPVYAGLGPLIQTNHKWFALMISESSWEMPDLEVLVAKKSWFNWVKAKKNGFWPWRSLSGQTLPYVPKELWPSIQQTEVIPGSGVAALCALELRETGRAVPRPAAAHSRELFQKWSQSLPGLWCKMEIVAFNLCGLLCCMIFFLWLVVLFVFVKWLCINSFGFLVGFVILSENLSPNEKLSLQLGHEAESAYPCC